MADGPWTKFQEPSAEAGPWAKFAQPEASKEIEPPDTSAEIKKRRALTVSQVPPFPLPGETPGGMITSPFRLEKAEELSKGPGKQLEKDIQTGALTMAGAGIGGAAVEGLVAEAEAVAGGSKLLKFLLSALTRGSGVGFGAGAGTLAGGGTPKEALGTAAGFTGAEMGTEAAVKTLKPVGKFAKDLMKSKVTKLEEAHAAETAQAKAAYEEQVQAHKQKMLQIEQEHKQQLADMETKHTQNVEEHKRAIQATAQMEEQKAAQAEAEYQKELKAHKEKVADLNKTYQAKVEKFKTAEGIRAQQKELGTTVGENVKLADKTIAKKLGGEFDAVNEAVEAKNPPMRPTDATKSARSEIIFPDSLAAFNNIVKNLGENVKGGEFSKMRASYTKLNELLYSGSELPTDLYKAVKVMRDSLGRDLRSAAASVGQGERYASAMKNWAEYMDDWHDTSSLAKGGSPIARLLQAEDPAFVVDQFGGKASERLIKTLEKYKQYGVNTELAANLKDSTSRLKSMSVSKELPKEPKLPTEPQRGAAPTFTKIPTPPQAPTPPISVAIPTPPQAPQIQPFDLASAERQQLIDIIRKALLVGGGGATVYGLERLFGGKGSTPVP